eukprot:scaffold41547_cov64-Attheya_sp.AAC.1
MSVGFTSAGGRSIKVAMGLAWASHQATTSIRMPPSTTLHVWQDFFKHKKARTICDRRQTRVLDDENAGASRSFECQGHSAMIITLQYAKW